MRVQCSRNIQHNFSMKYMFEFFSKWFSLGRPITRFQQIKQSLLQVKTLNPTHYSTYIISSLLFWADFRRGLWTVLTPGKQFDSKFHPVPNTLTGRLAQMIWIPSMSANLMRLITIITNHITVRYQVSRIDQLEKRVNLASGLWRNG